MRRLTAGSATESVSAGRLKSEISESVQHIRVGTSESVNPSHHIRVGIIRLGWGPTRPPSPAHPSHDTRAAGPRRCRAVTAPNPSPRQAHTPRATPTSARARTHTHTHTHTPGRRGGAGFPHATGRRARCAHSHPHTRARTDARTRTRTRTLTHTLTSRTRTLTLRTRTQYTHCTAAADAAPAGGNQGAVETAASARCEGIRVVSRRHPSRLAKASEPSRESIRVTTRRLASLKYPSHGPRCAGCGGAGLRPV